MIWLGKGGVCFVAGSGDVLSRHFVLDVWALAAGLEA